MSKLHIKKGDIVFVNAGEDKGKTGGIEKKEAPIHLSNLNVVDPKSGKATRIGRKLNEKGALVRYSKKSGEEIK